MQILLLGIVGTSRIFFKTLGESRSVHPCFLLMTFLYEPWLMQVIARMHLALKFQAHLIRRTGQVILCLWKSEYIVNSGTCLTNSQTCLIPSSLYLGIGSILTSVYFNAYTMNAKINEIVLPFYSLIELPLWNLLDTYQMEA